MKGVIFTLFQDMIEEEFGLECWEYLIADESIKSGGVYTTVYLYPDEELLTLVKRLSDYLNESQEKLVEHFGEYLLPHLVKSLPPSVFNYTDLWSFLAAIDDVIHVEVRKLNPDALTPVIKVLSGNKNTMTLTYSSPRKMCFLAVGLIINSGKYFNTPVNVTHGQCMHSGAENCHLIVNLEENVSG